MPGPITHRQPSLCPVCSDSLITLRLGCPTCGTEVSGHFDTCRYCRLEAADSDILEVFLRGRGNVRDVQAHLGVSYPTARARLGEVLDRLGFGDETPAAGPTSADPAAGAPSGPSGSGTPAPATPTRPVRAAEVARILDDLAGGRMTTADAEAAIRALPA